MVHSIEWRKVDSATRAIPFASSGHVPDMSRVVIVSGSTEGCKGAIRDLEIVAGSAQRPSIISPDGVHKSSRS